MIVAVAGTTGELIKLAPLLRRLGDDALLATTAQQATQIRPLLEELELPPPAIVLANGAGGHDLERNGEIPRWLLDVARGTVAARHELREARSVVVHGDTMTTFLGTTIGRLLRRPVAHVEAGLRSHDLRHPFPEEAIRRVTSRLAQVHYAPGPVAAAAVAGRGIVVDTGMNTIRDAIELVPDLDPPVAVPSGPFGVVSLHRFELINDRSALTATLDALRASKHPLLFIEHPVTVAALRRFGLDVPNRITRLRFFGWIQLLRRASFVISDSGGAQEECYVLDRPCLVHRRRSERLDGLGETSVLSGLRPAAVAEFLSTYETLRRREPLAAGSPSDVIADDLLARGLV